MSATDVKLSSIERVWNWFFYEGYSGDSLGALRAACAHIGSKWSKGAIYRTNLVFCLFRNRYAYPLAEYSHFHFDDGCNDLLHAREVDQAFYPRHGNLYLLSKGCAG